MEARGDVANDPERNGELVLQTAVVEWFVRQDAPRPFVAVDVGANVGDWSLPLLRTCASLEVEDVRLVAFEPIASTRAALEERLAPHRRAAAIEVEPVAVSSQAGEAVMHNRGAGAGTSSLHADPTAGDGDQEIVRMETIDGYMAAHAISTIDILKCDAEGHDLEVLRGCANAFASGSIAVAQFEYNARWVFARAYLLDVFELIDGLSYSLAKLRPDGMELLPAWHPELERFFEGNYVLVRDDVRANLAGVRSGRFLENNTYIRD